MFPFPRGTPFRISVFSDFRQWIRKDSEVPTRSSNEQVLWGALYFCNISPPHAGTCLHLTPSVIQIHSAAAYIIRQCRLQRYSSSPCPGTQQVCEHGRHVITQSKHMFSPDIRPTTLQSLKRQQILGLIVISMNCFSVIPRILEGKALLWQIINALCLNLFGFLVLKCPPCLLREHLITFQSWLLKVSIPIQLSFNKLLNPLSVQ